MLLFSSACTSCGSFFYTEANCTQTRNTICRPCAYCDDNEFLVGFSMLTSLRIQFIFHSIQYQNTNSLQPSPPSSPSSPNHARATCPARAAPAQRVLRDSTSIRLVPVPRTSFVGSVALVLKARSLWPTALQHATRCAPSASLALPMSTRRAAALAPLIAAARSLACAAAASLRLRPPH
jgi:hypothetical protein